MAAGALTAAFITYMAAKKAAKNKGGVSGTQTTKVEPYTGAMPDPDALWEGVLGEFFGYNAGDVTRLEKEISDTETWIKQIEGQDQTLQSQINKLESQIMTASRADFESGKIDQWEQEIRGLKQQLATQQEAFTSLPELKTRLNDLNTQLVTAKEGTGELGLKEKLTGQQEWLDEKYGGYLSDIERAGGIRETGLLSALDPYQEAMENKLQLSFGGEPVTSFVTRPDREVAESLFSKGLMLPELQAGNIERLGGMKWAGEQDRPLHGADLKFLEALMSLSGSDLNRRFGLPSQTQTGFMQGPEASLLAQLGSSINIGSGLMDLYNQGGGGVAPRYQSANIPTQPGYEEWSMT